MIESLSLGYRSRRNVVGRKSDCRPTIGVHTIVQRTGEHHLVAIGLIQVALVILLNHNTFLGFELAGRKTQTRHSVAFEPQRSLDICRRESNIKIGIIVVGEGVVFAAGHLHGSIEIGDTSRTSKHQVLKQMSKSRMVGVLVSRTDTIEQIDCCQLRIAIAARSHAQSVREGM